MLGLGLVGAAPISCSAYVFGGSVYTCIQKCGRNSSNQQSERMKSKTRVAKWLGNAPGTKR